MVTLNQILLWAVLFLIVSGCNENENRVNDSVATIRSGDLTISFNDGMKTNLSSKLTNELTGDFVESSFLSTRNKDFSKFKFTSLVEKSIVEKQGKGTLYTLTGMNVEDEIKIQKRVLIKSFFDFPNMLFFQVDYINLGVKEIKVKGWTNQHYQINRNIQDSVFWAFQGSSTTERKDWIAPIGEDFYNDNFFGMNQADYGGGVPILDVWRSDGGLAIGHTELVPKQIYTTLETSKDGRKADVSIKYIFLEPVVLEQNDTIHTFETFVAVHKGDCFSIQQSFTKYMQQKGLKFVPPEPTAYEPIWCAWGYERGFTLDEIIGTLPKVKELGFKWAVLDDGYQITEGDWKVNNQKFPQGDKQMKALVDKIHSYGLKAKIWWAPLAVDYKSNLLEEKPNILLRNADESPQYITWWDAFYMSPVSPDTKKHTEEVLDLFLNNWGFDGLKMDGQHMNACPPDYAHSSDNPEAAVEALPIFFKNIYNYSRKIKPNAVIENCPCGCCMSFYNMPYLNQTVSSDPLSSWQIRTKGKVYKALLGKTAYYGDHVELSDEGNDFASSFGVGAVLGSKFTYPKDNPTAEASYLLTPEKEISTKKWIALYNELMLSKEEYLGDLYDIGFDRPETHVIKKGTVLYYAFYAKEFSGELDLRGLEQGVIYEVMDYFNNKSYGEMDAANPKMKTSFQQFLLLSLSPKN